MSLNKENNLRKMKILDKMNSKRDKINNSRNSKIQRCWMKMRNKWMKRRNFRMCLMKLKRRKVFQKRIKK